MDSTEGTATTGANNGVPPSLWLTNDIAGLIALICNMVILSKEVKARKSDSVVFTTKYSEIFSITSMINGVVHAFFKMIAMLNIACHFSISGLYIGFFGQGIFMGLYQLDRLYYCFSTNKVFSRKGYPKCLFLIMYAIGVCLYFIMIGTSIYLHMYMIKICGIEPQQNYQFIQIQRYNSENSQYFIALIWLFYSFWDLLTLALYGYKVYTFRILKHQNKEIYQRIMGILNRILILTIMYQIVFVIESIFEYLAQTKVGVDQEHNPVIIAFWYSFIAVVSVTWSASMFLMQQHNTEYYRKFLHKLSDFGLHYLFCFCCIKWIKQEMNHYSKMEKTGTSLELAIENGKGNTDRKMTDDMTKMTVNDQNIDVDPYEMSVQTFIE